MKNLLSGVGLLVILLVISCSSDRTTEPFQWPVPLSIKGDWTGTLTHTTFYDTDSASAVQTYRLFHFDDSLWGFAWMPSPDSYPDNLYCYSTDNRYAADRDSVHLYGACFYTGIIDGRLAPRQEFRIGLMESTLVMTHRYLHALPEADVRQVMDLRRVSD